MILRRRRGRVCIAGLIAAPRRAWNAVLSSRRTGMEVAQPRRSYRTLDGLRGVGAFMVVMRHVPGFFGPIRVPESFLAVDLFYLVSGFVVAHAYGERLNAGGFLKAFMKTRLIRLYPLYFIGMAIGLVAAIQIGRASCRGRVEI